MSDFLILSLPSCQPCKNLKQVMEHIQSDAPFNEVPRFTFEYINLETRHDLVEKYEVSSVPVLVNTQDDTVILRGLFPRDKIKALVQKCLVEARELA